MILNPPTYKQLDYVAVLRRRHNISAASFETWCRGRFGSPFAELDKYQVSSLIDEMSAWESVPADLRKAAGQLDLFGGLA